jgi:hypothetical protein
MKRKKFIIPIDEEGNIDEKYIEMYFKPNLEQNVINLKKKIDKILKVIPLESNFDDKKTRIDEIFFIKSGGARKGLRNYSNGNIPYVSSGSTNNSVIGMVSSLNENEITDSPAITVTAFCQARVQLWDFIGRGNGGSAIKILIPKKPIKTGELLWYASQINAQSWKYNYGIMISQKRLKQLLITPAPNEYKIDLDISSIYS